MHWLYTAAARAGIPNIAKLDLPTDLPAADGWARVEKASGLTHRELAIRVAAALRIAPADLAATSPSATALIPERLARKYHVCALRGDERTITIATANPTDLEAEKGLGFATGKRVIFELATHAEISDALAGAVEAERAVESMLTRLGADDADNVRVIEEDSPELISARDVESAPIVRLTSLLLSEAVSQGASDIHIEPANSLGGTVRFRIDGVMRHYIDLPGSAVTRIVSRIKVLAQLDIADRMRPQDGRARIQVGEKAYDLRISTVPTRDTEKAVIRILRSDTLKTIDELRLSPHELTRLRQVLSVRDGMVIITGPTGSGKTTTLYGAVKEIANGQVNVMTVEDPVEYEIRGVTQLQVDVKKGLTFASALRSILRQDPDVILVGEIRDAETAAIAVQAALTGHLVLATLHTTDAMGVVTRLQELGIDPAAIASVLRGAIAQRLARRVCGDCSQPIIGARTPEEERLASQYGAPPVVRVIGCPRCAGTGFLGRIPLVEVAPITPALAEQISSGASSAVLQRLAITQGMVSMRQVGLQRVTRGETTLHEIDRILGDSATDSAGPGSDFLARISRPIELEPIFSDFGVVELPPVNAVVPSAVEEPERAVRERRGPTGDRRKKKRRPPTPRKKKTDKPPPG